MNDLDDILGPVAAAPLSASATRVVRVFRPPEKVSNTAEGAQPSATVKDTRPAQAKLTAFRGVEAESDERKAAREAARRLRAEEREAAARTAERRAEEAENAVFLAELAKEEARIAAQAAEKRARTEEWERRRVISHDSSEKPTGFVWSDADDMREGMGNGDAEAVRLDKLIPVKEYYVQGAFPADALAIFCTRNGRVPLNQCEIGFVVNGSWWRSKRFSDSEDLRRFVASVNVERIDLGPVHPPNEMRVKESHSRLPLERYLVFDVDLEDRSATAPRGYARACKCKGSKSVCTHGCWFFMRVAVKVLTYLLRQMLGAKHILPVYSGRRGVHVWALDETFVTYTQADREGVVRRILHYSNPDAYEHNEHTPYIMAYILRPVFVDRFLDGAALVRDQGTQVYLMEVAAEYIPDPGRRQSLIPLVARLSQGETPAERGDAWDVLCMTVDGMAGRPPGSYERRAIFTLLFPRIDAEVTSQMGHCIKAPFVVHPVTKRCSVPIPDVDTWTPDKAPRLSELVAVPANDKNKPRFAPEEWVLEREAAKRAMMLDPFVRHVDAMVRAAYPQVPMSGFYGSAAVVNSRFY